MSPIIYIGNISIALAIGLSLFGIIAYYTSSQIQSANAQAFGRASIYGNFILMTVANLAMVYALLHNDFGVSYVAHVGAIETPRWVAAISLWSSLEGSILFWGFLLSAYSAVCVYMYRDKGYSQTSPLPRGEGVGGRVKQSRVGHPLPSRERETIGWVGLVLLGIQLFFFVLLAFPANPFHAVFPVPGNGPGPNPLLQNHWLMAIHPPCLYMGYIGFTIPFAFAIAALLEKDISGSWLPLTRKWTLFAWSFQSVAIMLGAWWSYAVLGWGGYWAWDPVENASFLPWLTGTALVHSVIVQEKRKMLPVWNLTLAITTFLLTLLGTFLTRSGVLDSVHSFTESAIGPYFLSFTGIVLAVSIGLLLWRAPLFKQNARFENLLSLEVLFLFNNLLFVSFCFIVFLGTWYPLVVEALQGKRISVGEPYFNQMSVPITLMILLVLGIGLLTPWRKGEPKKVSASARLPLILSALVTSIAWLLGARSPWIIMTLFLCGFPFFVMLLEVIRLSKSRSPFELLVDNPRRYGGFVSHLGALLVVIGIAFSSAYETDREVTLKRGESAIVANYSLTFHEMVTRQAPQRFEVLALVDVERNGKFLGEMTPQMNYYSNSREPIATPAIRSTLLRDFYLTLIQVEEDGSEASLRVIATPAVAWIWIGGFVVMLGGMLALSCERKKESN